MTVHAQMTASPTVQGCVVMVFIPLSSSTEDNLILANPAAISVNQCSYLFPNTNTAATMEIKFNSPYTNLDTTGATTALSSLGTLYFVNFNALQLSEGASDNIDISLFCSFTNNKFKIPRLTPLTVRMQSGKASLLDTLVDTVLPDNMLGDVIKTVGAEFLPFDKPLDPRLALPNKVISTQYMNFSSGSEAIDRMTNTPAHLSVVDGDTFGTTTDEMDMDYLLMKYSYLGSFNIDTSQTSGALLATLPLNPCPTPIVGNTAVPLLHYMSIPFNYWTGPLNYKFQVVSTMMQTCKILISVNYGSIASSGLPLNQLASQYGQVVEINQGSNAFEITVDYAASTPALFIPSGNKPSLQNSMGTMNITLLNALVATNGAPTSIAVNVFIAGSSGFSYNTLALAGNLLPSSLSPPPLPRMKQRLYVAEEKPDLSDYDVVVTRKFVRAPALKPQSGSAQPLIAPVSEIDTPDENLISGSETVIRPRPPIGQKHTETIRDVLKKYQLVLSTTLSHTGSQGYLNTVLPVASLLCAKNRSGLLNHFAKMYRLSKGSFNFKLTFKFEGTNPADATTLSDLVVQYLPPFAEPLDATSFDDLTDTLANTYLMDPAFLSDPTYNARSSAAACATALAYNRLPVHFVNGVTRTAEFNIPYTSNYASQLLNVFDDGTVAFMRDMGYISIQSPVVSAGVKLHMSVFMSIGDETRFGTLFNVPTLVPVQQVDGAYLYPDDYTAPTVPSFTLKKVF